MFHLFGEMLSDIWTGIMRKSVKHCCFYRQSFAHVRQYLENSELFRVYILMHIPEFLGNFLWAYSISSVHFYKGN